MPVTIQFPGTSPFVQVVSSYKASSISNTVTLPSVTVGDLLLMTDIWADFFNVGIAPTIVDTMGNIWTLLKTELANFGCRIYCARAKASGDLTINTVHTGATPTNYLLSVSEYQGVSITPTAVASNSFYSSLPNPVTLAIAPSSDSIVYAILTCNGGFGACGGDGNLPVGDLQVPYGYHQRVDFRGGGGVGNSLAVMDGQFSGPTVVSWAFNNQIANVETIMAVAMKITQPEYVPGNYPYALIDMKTVGGGSFSERMTGAYVCWRTLGQSGVVGLPTESIGSNPLLIDVLDTGYRTSIGSKRGPAIICTSPITFLTNDQVACGYIPLEMTAESVVRIATQPNTLGGFVSIVFTNRKLTPFTWGVKSTGAFPPFVIPQTYGAYTVTVNGTGAGDALYVGGAFVSTLIQVNGVYV